MKEYFSENIKNLRRKSNMTQEKLSECIGVLPQTVSKWERAESYPDIELLPTIANYFGVTIDELLGNDRIRTNEEIDKLIAKSRETARIGKEAEALELSRSGYKKYPYSHKMMARYGKDLMLYCEGEDRKAAFPEVEKIAKTLLEDSSDDNLRYDALEMLGDVYGSYCYDNPEDYKKLCEHIPEGFDFTRELWLERVYPITTDEGLALRQENMLKLMWWFEREVDELCGFYFEAQPQRLPDIETKIRVRKMELEILHCIFNDGDYMQYSWNAAWYSYHLFELLFEAGDRAQALKYLKDAAEYCVAWETRPSYAERTSFLVDHVVYDRNKELAQGMCGSPEYYLERLCSSKYSELADDPTYIYSVKTLEECPKRQSY